MELSFPTTFVRCVMACVRGVSYSILLNGIPSPPFQAKQGLRQGDPLPPFLFAICMEYLSRCLGELKDNPDFNFHPKRERLSLTHLMFADDLLLFSRADVSSVTKSMAAFNKFSQASCLEAILEKSNIYLAGVSAYDANLLAEAVQLRTREFPFKYLGVPLSSKKLNFSQCKILIDKIAERAQG